ncbi:MAG TPA: hypothetical protein DCL86_09750 [Bacteroidales bacterium]|nr:hypothetical protein [Bacteroidales bacterium]
MPKKKRRKIKFKAVKFKLTSLQKAKVDAFCRENGTTPVTMYKKAILFYLKQNGYGNYKPTIPPEEHQNQMSIFDFIE